MIIFTRNLKGPGFVKILQNVLLSFLQNLSHRHRLMMHNAHSYLTKMDLNGINYFPTPAQSTISKCLLVQYLKYIPHIQLQFKFAKRSNAHITGLERLKVFSMYQSRTPKSA